eukprot:scaffold356435_cov24-Prasinocladus_malaysianus.AAC.1
MHFLKSKVADVLYAMTNPNFEVTSGKWLGLRPTEVGFARIGGHCKTNLSLEYMYGKCQVLANVSLS